MSADVVLDENGNPVQGPARTLCLAFFIERPCDGDDVWIDFNHRVDCRAVFVNLFDAGQVFFGQGQRAVSAGFHAGLEFGNRRLVQVERLDFGTSSQRSCLWPDAGQGWTGQRRRASQGDELQKIPALHLGTLRFVFVFVLH